MIFDKKYDIFISYRHNNMTLIGEVVNRLEKYYDVFWDQRLESGYWNEQLTSAIDNSGAVLINLNVNSLKKNSEGEDWFYKEIVYSMNTKKKEEIIPVCYDGFEFPANLDTYGITAEEKEKIQLLRDRYQRITDIKSLDLIIEKIIQYLSGIGIAPKVEYIRRNDSDLSLKIEKIVPVKSFVGREKELEEMIEFVHTNDIVFLSGMGGIGKTELAKKFMEEMTGEYRCIFLKYDVSLKNTLSKIEINGLETADFAKKEAVLKKLLTGNVVLVIDNFDFDSDENIDDYIYEFCQYSCKKLITTRNLFSELEFPCSTEFIVLDTLKNSELRELFEDKYKEEITDAQFEKILKFTGGLTLIVPILASLCLKSDMTVDELCEKISEGMEGLRNSDSVNYVKDGNKKGSVPEILHILFNIEEINNEKKKTLCNLSLLQFMEVTKNLYRKLCFENGQGNLDAFNELVDAGWIKQTGNNGEKAYYELHPLINSLVKEVLMPSQKTCPELFRSIKEMDKERVVNDIYGLFLSGLNYYDRENYVYLASEENLSDYIPFYKKAIGEILFSKEKFDNADGILAASLLHSDDIKKDERKKKFLLDMSLYGDVSSNVRDNFIFNYCIVMIKAEDEKIFGKPDYPGVEKLCKELMGKCSSLSVKNKIKSELSSLKYWVERGQYIKVTVEEVLDKLHQSENIEESFKLVETVWRICGLKETFREDIFMHFLKKDSTKEEVEAVIDATIKRYGDQDLRDEYGINEGYHIGMAMSQCCVEYGYDFLSYEKCFEFFKKLYKSENVINDACVMCGDTMKMKSYVDSVLFSKPVEEKTDIDISTEETCLRYLKKGFLNGDYTKEYTDEIFGYAESLIRLFGDDKERRGSILRWLRSFERAFENDDLKSRAKELKDRYILKISGVRLKNRS